MNTKITDAMLWALAFVAIAITIAAGVRIVDWIVGGDVPSPEVWRSALIFVGASTAGGAAVATIRRNGHDDDLPPLT